LKPTLKYQEYHHWRGSIAMN